RHRALPGGAPLRGRPHARAVLRLPARRGPRAHALPRRLLAAGLGGGERLPPRARRARHEPRRAGQPPDALPPAAPAVAALDRAPRAAPRRLAHRPAGEPGPRARRRRAPPARRRRGDHGPWLSFGITFSPKR